MPQNVKISLIVIVSILLLLLAFGAGCLINLGPAPSGGLDVNLIEQAWNIINRNYVEPAKIDQTKLSQGAVNGVVQALEDPYSYYLSPEDNKLTQGNFQSSFGGIGATISMNKDRQPVVVGTIENSPSANAGIKNGDIILAVNDKSTEGLAVDQVVMQVRGPIGTTVKLTVLHEGQSAPVDIEIVRAEINPTTVSYRMEGDIAYIKLTNFYENYFKVIRVFLQSFNA